MPSRTHLFIITLLATVFAGSAVAQSSITLRSSVRLPANAQQVRLTDIAELSGADAVALADLVIAELGSPTEAVVLTIRQVRAKLDEAGIHWGRTSLSGRQVTVRPRRSGSTTPPMAMGEAAVDGSDVTERQPVRSEPQRLAADELIKRNTLRGTIAAYLIHALDVNAHDLQLTFDERHADYLDAIHDGVQFEIEPSSNVHSARVDLTVRVWINGLIDHRRSFSVSPLVRTPVAVMREEVRRDALISEASLVIEQQWLPPLQTGLVHDPAEVAGRHATVRLREGEVLRHSHLRRETLIRRGEQVIVRCLVGSAVITVQAEARADGAEGDTIEFRKLGERETFLATVTSRNEAILNLSR